MDNVLKFSAPTRSECLQMIRDISLTHLEVQCQDRVPQDALPWDYIGRLPTAERTIALRACLMCWTATEAHMVPRVMQLQAILADRLNNNSLISAGTGSGKTLPIAINIQLDNPDDHRITITVSPLKRLQAVQETDFNEKFGIRTVTINDDTPRDNSWWSKCVWEPKRSNAQLLIVTVEQLFKTVQGHMPRLGEWLRERPAFQKLIKRINIDEAHFIYTAGEKLYGAPAFRPAWGLLGNLKRSLPKRIMWHLYSATFPSHILTHIKQNLLAGSETVYIHVTSNRPNIMYATHEVDNIDNVRQYECFLTSPFNLDYQPHVLIFVDNKNTTALIQDHLDSCLPVNMRDKGVVKHYHSSMSQDYLEATHNDFVSSSGMCRILIATSGQSVGVDFPNVQIVCAAGLPPTLVDTLQRCGRALRVGNEDALFIIFFEPWVHDISLNDYDENASRYNNDPDRPSQDLTNTSQRKSRAPYSLVCLIKSLSLCIREAFAIYLDDKTPEAMIFTTPFCCERHENGFNLQALLPGKLHVEVASGTKRKEHASKPGNVRPKAERIELDKIMRTWLDSEVIKDVGFLGRQYYEILTDDARKKLLHFRGDSIISPMAIVRALDETEEWGNEFGPSIHKLIVDFDKKVSEAKVAKSVANKTAKAVSNTAGSFSSGQFVISTQESYGTVNRSEGGTSRQVRRRTTKQ